MTTLAELATLIFSELDAGNYPGSKIECIEAILKRGMLQWTSEKPKVPGWYWWRQTDAHEIVGVTEFSMFAGRWCYWHDDDWLPLKHAKVEIAGPLEPPC